MGDQTRGWSTVTTGLFQHRTHCSRLYAKRIQRVWTIFTKSATTWLQTVTELCTNTHYMCHDFFAVSRLPPPRPSSNSPTRPGFQIFQKQRKPCTHTCCNCCSFTVICCWDNRGELASEIKSVFFQQRWLVLNYQHPTLPNCQPASNQSIEINL